MKQKICLGLCLLTLLGGTGRLSAQITSVQFIQTNYWNLQSRQGMPISTLVDPTIGSNGRLPLTNSSGSTFPAPTTNTTQFAEMLSFGGVTATTNNTALSVNNGYLQGTSNFNGTVAQAMQLPVGLNPDKSVRLVLKMARIGAPYVSQQVSYNFGSVIPPPTSDYTGTNNNVPLSYWRAIPLFSTNSANNLFYYSTNAGVVFATQPGPISITWISSATYTAATLPPYTNQLGLAGSPNYITNSDGTFSLLFTANYLISPNPVKTPQKIYWTQGAFQSLSHPVLVPVGQISSIHVVFNAAFPQFVTNSYSVNNGITNAQTLWYDPALHFIFANAQEGRVFMELLGQPNGNGSSEFLGFELVDVTKSPTPNLVTNELGTQLTPYQDPTLGGDLNVAPLPNVGTQFYYNFNGTTYYADRETTNLTDLQMYWTDTGVAGLQWPYLFNRYALVWPSDSAKYSYYLRPAAVNQAQAALTSVQLDPLETPSLDYFDPLDKPRAFMTPTFSFYTWLTNSVPAQRALLRFNAGGNIRFERVLSCLSAAVQDTSLLGNSIFTNLTSFANYLNYPVALSNYNAYLANVAAYNNYVNYTNYLGTRNRGVNGAWTFFTGYFNGPTGPAGAIGSWALDVVSQAVVGGPLVTNEFAAAGFAFGTNSYGYTTANVTGITNTVTAVLLKMNGVTNSNPANMFVYVYSPNTSFYLFYAPGATTPATNVNLIFNDQAANKLTTSFTSGSYKPSFSAMDSFLLPAVTPVSAPPQPFVTSLPDPVSNPVPVLTPWPSQLATSGLVKSIVNVGDRIVAPAGELGSTNGTRYLAGYINTNFSTSFLSITNVGNSYDPGAYLDPFMNGVGAASAGAIIPVNAIPGQNHLEVWWFRPNDADNAAGFQTVYWPTVIGDYTIQWPGNAPKIVLAGNAGSGPLDSLHASGIIYYQNVRTQPGYNPNEEHALMLGGQAYALRDDLNITNAAATNYSSAPFVLLAYTEADGRSAMTAYQVLRENSSAGVYFDYIVAAGTQLQAPMPLPLMALPITPNTNYPSGLTNYDTEPSGTSGDLPTGWTSAAANGPFSLYPSFTFQDRKNNFWVYRGLNAGLPPLQAGKYNVANNSFGPLPDATGVVNSNFQYFVHVSRQLASLTVGMDDLPPGLTWQANPTNGLSILGTNTTAGAYPVTITLTDSADSSQVVLSFNITVVNTPGPNVVLGPLVLSSTNIYSHQLNTYSNRPPSLAQAPSPTNSFTMRFYYKTLPGFAWPSITIQSNWPAVGSIVPYLRPQTNGVFAGDPTSSNTPSLDIVYRPVWPELGPDGLPLPTLAQGQTLTTAVGGIPAVRGQDSVQILYQQSIATNAILTNTACSVVLFDPTVQKKSVLVNGLPASVLTDPYNGLFFFPNLPPNLISRFWFDPNGNKLVFTGQFVSDPVKGDYVMLNVLRGDDLAAINNLCPASDTVNHPIWTNAVANLSTPEYTFYQNPAIPGSYVINNTPGVTVTDYAGDIVEVTNSDTAVDSYALSAVGPGQGYVTYVVANGLNPHYAGDPVSVYIARTAPPLFQGALVLVNSANASPFSQLVTFQHTADLAGRTSQYMYDWRIEPPVNGQPPALGTEPSWTQLSQNPGGPVYTLGASGIQGLTDNYISMRYGYYATNNGVVSTNWSPWADPILAPGWISRVTQALDPIAGRTQDLYNNAAFTTASIIQLAGTRWNGDVPLNAGSLTNSGLIQLYETVLDVGESLSINSGINYGPANQALLLASGYLNDLYMTLGNAAWANSLNPTIGFGTDNTAYGSVATASFCFEGEEPTLLEQNLALLRGRDDSLSPGVNLPPAYNRLYWNYTYGLDAGQVIYALNYNITDQNSDGKVDAKDAQIMFPQGHGDAYGHYLTAMMNYYKLLMNPNFDWVPQAQTVLVLGAAVTVNYQNETKFAAAAGAVARTGRQVFDLTWREDYHPGTSSGWGYFASNHVGQYTYVDNNSNTQHVTRYWGMDHWASRVGQGTYLNWVVANSILPYKDTNPNDQGVQIVDRTTVQELQELPATAAALESDMDNANAGFTPLGLAQNAIPFDINPQQVTGANPQTHFEQVYSRAVQALNNAVVAFNAAQNVTQNLRQQQNSLSDLQAAVTAQEQAYNDQLIELYGTPYPDDFGPGGTYPYGYTGPDLLHYMYVDNAETNTFGGYLPDPTTNNTFNVDIQQFPANWYSNVFNNFDFIVSSTSPNYSNNTHYIAFNIGPDGFSKPPSWTDERNSIGSMQTALAAVNAAKDQFRMSCYNAYWDKQSLDQAMMLFKAQNATNLLTLSDQQSITSLGQDINIINTADNILNKVVNDGISTLNAVIGGLNSAFPKEVIAGLADGGDFLAPLEAIVDAPLFITEATILGVNDIAYGVAADVVEYDQNAILDYQQLMATNQYNINLQNAVQSLSQQEGKVQNDLVTINQAQVALNGAQANYQALLAKGNRIQQERLSFRQHAAARVQGYTVTDAAFLVFQNEDLERYTTLFNLAAEYAYMAANAYDYETGLLGTPAGQSFLNQIISSSALGVVQNGQPQISGSGHGDPGLANALAEMKADWDVVKGRLGFNNPDGYGTTVSLRTENYRIPAGTAGDTGWKQLLQQSVLPDLRADTDVKNNCLQIDNGSGQAVPGIELAFSTTITDGQNLFGQPLGPGDHNFSATSFATKLYSVGVCFDGYVGMDNPNSTGGITPPDPTLDPNGLAATPYVYLVPCGADSMRSPPLGDTSTIRTWNVDDVAIPLPFNIGASSFSSTPFYTAADSLSEPLFAVRKQQAFRPVSTTAVFNTSIYGANGAFQPSQYTNQRLIGRSIWNSKWKLIIPGKNLLSDPGQGLTRFINSVKDVHLYFITYSYAGN